MQLYRNASIYGNSQGKEKNHNHENQNSDFIRIGGREEQALISIDNMAE